MTLLERLNEDFISAYKARKMDTKDFIGFLKSEVTKESKTPDDAYIIGKFKSIYKNLLETGALSNHESVVLLTYIPPQLDEIELNSIIVQFLMNNNFKAGDKSAMGSVMKYLQLNYPGEYDGKLASQLIREILK